jgi:hypothetical protein
MAGFWNISIPLVKPILAVNMLTAFLASYMAGNGPDRLPARVCGRFGMDLSILANFGAYAIRSDGGLCA